MVKDQVESFIASSELGITYESIQYTLFDGITIQRLRISSSEDFSLGRILFEAPRVTIPVQFGLITGTLPQVKLEKAQWNLYLENPEEEDLFDKQLEQWSGLATNLQFVLVNNSVSIHLQKANYEKQIIAIKKISGSFENSAKGNLKIRLAYNSVCLEVESCSFSKSARISVVIGKAN